ncbi:hypothetical protein ACMDCR_13335 [Labrys okinawensis]|uniref:COG3904 family protein n=1 Tax=Labrys okinawensis TaxID=346911 RepID=UPI0039BC9567
MSRALLVLLTVIFSVLSIATAAPAKPIKSKPNNPAQTMDPMHIAIVRDHSGNCEPNCAEWIMMQGDIVAGTPPLLKRVLKLAGKRKLPVFVNSRGGKVEAGITLGQLIRANHLDVTVSKTILDPCDPKDRKCIDNALTGRKGSPQSYASECASSCAFLLAAGEARHVPYTAFVGVHQFTNYLTTTRYMNTYLRRRALVNGHVVVVNQKLVKQKVISQTTEKVATPKSTYDRAARYFSEMGIGDNINAILQTASPDSIHWLNGSELSSTHMMTDRQDGISQVLAINGELGGKTILASAPAPSAPSVTISVPTEPVLVPPAPASPPPAAATRTKTYVSADSDIPLGRYRGNDVTVDVTIHQHLGTPAVIVDFTPRDSAGPIPTMNLIAGVQIGDQHRRESPPNITAGSFQSLTIPVPVDEFCTLRQTDVLWLDLRAEPGGEFEEGKIALQTESRFMTAHAILADICGQAQATK